MGYLRQNIGRRRHIRIDTVLPVAVQLVDAASDNPLTDIKQGFTRDISRNGMCLVIRNLDKETVSLFEKAGHKILLHIDLIYKKAPVRVEGKIIFFHQDRFSPPNEFVLNIVFTDIEKSDASSLVRYALVRKNRMHIAILFSVLVGIAFIFATCRVIKTEEMKRLTEDAFSKLKLEKVNVEEKYAGSYNSKIKLEKKIKIYAENLKEIQKTVEEKELAEETRGDVEERIDEIQAAKKSLERELKKVLRKKEYYEKEIANLRDKFKSDEVRITFQNGTSMIGKVLYQGRDKIKLKIQYGIIDINKEEVDKIDFVTYAEKIAEEAKVKDLKIYHFENNGVWLDITWINQNRDVQEIARLRDFLRIVEIKKIFLIVKRDVGWLQSPEKLSFAGSFIKEMNRGNTKFEFYACLKGQTEFSEEPDTDLSGESDCRGIVDIVKGLCSEYPFDGILLNLAPVPNGNENFISLIKDLKKQVPFKKVSVVSMEWGSEGDIDVWEADYYREVTSLADFIIVPCYDAYFENSDIYISWIDEQIIQISNITKCNFLIGVSTSKKTKEEHNPVIENFDNALVGIRSGLNNKGTGISKFDGIAVMGNWSTTSDEWKTFLSLWVKKPFYVKEGR